MNGQEPILSVAFFRTASGNEPVREWLKSLPREERRIIGDDIKAVQFGWPLGMPLVRKPDKGLWEVRSRLPERIARVIFTTGESRMVLLMVSSRNRGRLRTKIWNWRKTRLRLLQ